MWRHRSPGFFLPAECGNGVGGEARCGDLVYPAKTLSFLLETSDKILHHSTETVSDSHVGAGWTWDLDETPAASLLTEQLCDCKGKGGATSVQDML